MNEQSAMSGLGVMITDFDSTDHSFIKPKDHTVLRQPGRPVVKAASDRHTAPQTV